MNPGIKTDTILQRHGVRIAFIYLALIAWLGVLMRAVQSGLLSLPLDFKHILHTHSHSAFQGWLYTLLFVAAALLFLDKEKRSRYRIKTQFIATQVLLAGSFVAFLLQGYAFWSIKLSSLFQLVSYIFVITIWRGADGWHGRLSFRFWKVAIVAMFLSTFGPWALAYIMSQGLGDTPAYPAAIYFFLHFQYNGWFLFALLGLYVLTLDESKIPYNFVRAEKAFFWLAAALIPSYAISVVDLFPGPAVHATAVLGALMQLAGLYWLIAAGGWKSLIKGTPSNMQGWWLRLAAFGFVLKVLSQLAVIFPGLHNVAYENRHVVIAYLHLSLLGVISAGLIALLARRGLLRLRGHWAEMGSFLFWTGFLATELSLGMTPFMISPMFFDGLLAAAAAMAVGLTIIGVIQFGGGESGKPQSTQSVAQGTQS